MADTQEGKALAGERAEVLALAELSPGELAELALAAGQALGQALADLVPHLGDRTELLDRVGRLTTLYSAQMVIARRWLIAANATLALAQATIERLGGEHG